MRNISILLHLLVLFWSSGVCLRGKKKKRRKAFESAKMLLAEVLRDYVSLWYVVLLKAPSPCSGLPTLYPTTSVSQVKDFIISALCSSCLFHVTST